MLGDLAPPERRALAEIVEGADVLLVNGRPWLVVPASPALLDRLAAFQATDLELDLADDEAEQDDDRENDNPADRDALALADDREDDDPRETDDEPEEGGDLEQVYA